MLRIDKLSLIATKIGLIIFHSNKHPLNNDSISIKRDGFKLTPVDYIKYIVIFIGKLINWNVHIEELKTK